eukprot:TRINITY_DN67559_c0_g1_i1.p1 TRINITY_DN67559_c0_g1~~TRINITY_DN67559_c0_g1_i1.p1  ORF type:complete len:579 (+),score=60.00 TRINITY_DN67559_c0_g1_i1:87-1739(+)
MASTLRSRASRILWPSSSRLPRVLNSGAVVPTSRVLPHFTIGCARGIAVPSPLSLVSEGQLQHVPGTVVMPSLGSNELEDNQHVGVADLHDIPTMRSSQLRRLCEAASSHGADPRVWDAIAARCEDSAETLQYWDVVLIVQAFAAVGFQRETTLLRLADALCARTSHLAPKHILDVFAAFEALGLRPRTLYVELFHALIRLSKSMYPEELSMSLQAMARHRLGNPTVVAHITRSIQRQIKEFRFRYLCSVAGALGSLEALPADVLAKLDERARLEMETVPVQELLDNLVAFNTMEFSWRPYEEMCLEGFLARIRDFETAEDVDQLVAPFDAMRFLQNRDLLSESFLEALCQWCLAGVHKPNVRSERRPTARQLVALHDICNEWGLGDSQALNDATLYYIESGAGQWAPSNPKPLRYKPGRKYHRTDDPLEHLDFGSIADPAASAKQHWGLPGLPGLSDDRFGDLALPVPSGDAPRPTKKPSEGSTVSVKITSRKGPRPRICKHSGLSRRKVAGEKASRPALFVIGGWQMRQRYLNGTEKKRFPTCGIHSK